MKVCIPSIGNKGLGDLVGEHFGRVPFYTIVDLDTNEVKVIPNTSQHMGGMGYAPEIMLKEKVDTMICTDLGRRAISMFENFGIGVYIGATGFVRDAVEAFNQGKLKRAMIEDACGRHMFRGR
jgi:predicted Fe-Mo cluster-binding NifX family protein